MFVLSPKPQHRQMAIQASDAPAEVFANKQLYNDRSPYLSSSKLLGKPAALPHPPRPPTPPGPRPGPLPGPDPGPNPVPSPPPSPRYLNSLMNGNNGHKNPLPPIPISLEPGLYQYPYPNPPPSPGPRGPGPVRPRPNVPTPPPSPRRSVTAATANEPWVIFSTMASSFAILLFEYLSSTTWDEQGDTVHEGDVSRADQRAATELCTEFPHIVRPVLGF